MLISGIPTLFNGFGKVEQIYDMNPYQPVQAFPVPFSGYVSSVQEVADHIAADSGMRGVWINSFYWEGRS